jgi:hypothetical protein
VPSLRPIAERVIRSLLHEENEAADFMGDFAQKSEKGLGPLPAEHEPSILRAVRMRGPGGESYYLVLWETGAQGDYGQSYLGYRFVMPDGSVLWQGTDFRPGMVHGNQLDDDKVLRQLISSITDDPETSGGEFEGWTPSQLEFAKSDAARYLESDYGEISSSDEGTPGSEFEDLPGYERQQSQE